MPARVHEQRLATDFAQGIGGILEKKNGFFFVTVCACHTSRVPDDV